MIGLLLSRNFAAAPKVEKISLGPACMPAANKGRKYA
jgi:hypothetical protein